MMRLPVFIILYLITTPLLAKELSQCASNLPVKSYKITATSEFNQSISRAASRSEVWVKNPLLVAIKFLGLDDEDIGEGFEGYGCRLISQENVSSNKAIIIVTEDGHGDDSVRGVKYKLELKNNGDIWQIIRSEDAWLCWRGDRLNVFSAALCP